MALSTRLMAAVLVLALIGAEAVAGLCSPECFQVAAASRRAQQPAADGHCGDASGPTATAPGSVIYGSCCAPQVLDGPGSATMTLRAVNAALTPLLTVAMELPTLLASGPGYHASVLSDRNHAPPLSLIPLRI